MTVRGFATADGRTVEHGQFGGFPEVGALAHALVKGVLRYGTGARVALPVGNLLAVRLDEPRAAHDATLPVAFER